MESIALLINHGHVNAFQYTYSFFCVALKTLEKEKKQEIAGMACAVGLAFSGKEAIEKMLKD